MKRSGRPSPETAQALRRRMDELTHAEVYELARLLEAPEEAAEPRSNAKAPAKGAGGAALAAARGRAKPARPARRKRTPDSDRAA